MRGIQLPRVGSFAVVVAETDTREWIAVAAEHVAGAFSHYVSRFGLRERPRFHSFDALRSHLSERFAT